MSARSTRSRSASRGRRRLVVGSSMALISTSMGRRRRRRASSRLAVDEQSVEPGVEPVRVTKPGQVTPGANEGVLDRVARELRVPEDEARGRVQPRDAARRRARRRRRDRPALPARRAAPVHGPWPLTLVRRDRPVRRVWRRRAADRFAEMPQWVSRTRRARLAASPSRSPEASRFVSSTTLS